MKLKSFGVPQLF